MPIKEPKFPKNWGLVDGKPFTFGDPKNNLNTGQLTLLAAAEESYSQAASVLQPLVREWVMEHEWLKDHTDPSLRDLRSRFETGLHLLEEAMNKHNQYMDSLK